MTPDTTPEVATDWTAAELDAASAMAEKAHLSPFGDTDVVRTSIKVTNAGDGLSAALAIQPQELAHGDEVWIVMQGIVAKVGHDPIDPKDPHGALVRVHTIRAEAATLLNEAGVKKVKGILARQVAAIRKAVEEARGIHTFGDADPEFDDTGLHLVHDPEEQE
jgi:hypothetical protein